MLEGVWTEGLTWSSRADQELRRHKTDFVVLEELGRGGFGRVYRVRHRLDGKEYALKVVRASSNTDEMEKIVREVQVLSSIQSNYVVRYYSAWIERGDLISEELDDSSQGDEEEALGWMTSSGEESSFTTTADTRGAPKTKTTTTDDDPICNLCQSNYKDWEVTLEQWGLIDTVLQPLNLCVDCYKTSIPAHTYDVSNISIRETTVLPECLYILMEYCESTLLEAAEAEATRNKESSSSSSDSFRWSLFAQILEGFAHLHANAIIHRDVKPSNILVHENVVKIGDLGLATKNSRTHHHHHHQQHQNQHHHSNYSSFTREETINGNHQDHDATSQTPTKSNDVGTYFYMAPEMRRSSSTGNNHKKHPSSSYDERVDIYSLGVVLVELFHSPFGTGMERAKVLGDLMGNVDGQEPIFPPEWTVQHPVAHDLARRMLQPDPKDRPSSCLEILQEFQTVVSLSASSSSRGVLPVGTNSNNNNLAKQDKNSSTQHSSISSNLQSQVRSLQETVDEQHQEIVRLRKLLEQHDIVWDEAE
jgi:translation initiation factor 2-alpha kinase 4